MSKIAPAAARLPKILRALARAYPDAHCTLHFTTPLELLVATILSAQCTDQRVNLVTATLFRTYRRAADYARADLAKLQQGIRQINFFRNKARHIKTMAQLLVERHGGQVPDRMEELIALPGVARKTANVVLGNAFGKAEGIVVDTHVMRLAGRLELSVASDRDQIERDLMALVPRSAWTIFAHRLITHGRTVCKAIAPRCTTCVLGQALCPSYRPTGSGGPQHRVVRRSRHRARGPVGFDAAKGRAGCRPTSWGV